MIVIDSVKLRFKFLITETPLNLLPNFVADPINIPFSTTSMLGTTIVSTSMVIIPASSD